MYRSFRSSDSATRRWGSRLTSDHQAVYRTERIVLSLKADSPEHESYRVTLLH